MALPKEGSGLCPQLLGSNPCHTWQLCFRRGLVTKKHKIILKFEIPITYWVMWEKQRQCQKNSIIKWKWYMQRSATRECKEVLRVLINREPLFSLGWTLALPDKLLDSTATWTQSDGHTLTNKELSDLWMAVLKWIDYILIGRLPLWRRFQQIRLVGGLNCMFTTMSCYQPMGSGQWPEHMVPQEGKGKLAY